MTSDEGQDQQESSEEIRPSRMTAREQQIGYAVAALGGVVAVVAATKGEPVLGGVAAVAAVGLGISSRYGHRIVAAFVAILGGFAFLIPANFAFLGYGGYLMWRSSRAQAKLRASQPRMTPAQRREARQARRAARRGDAPPPPSVKRPTQSRRYTPPRAKAKPGRQRRPIEPGKQSS
jgi:hypothetical protein